MAIAKSHSDWAMQFGRTELELCKSSIPDSIVTMSEQSRRTGLHLVTAEIALPDCGLCPHRESVLAAGRCQPGDRCLIAHSGRQIDRFLSQNPEYADACLNDAFWERRAIAVRYASPERVAELAADPDEVVRRAVAIRLPVTELVPLRHDPDREVRITVAARLPLAWLAEMMHDPDYLVRQHVAERLPHGRLPRMADDPDREVRKAVARRLPAFALKRMVNDADDGVRRIVAARMLPEDAAGLLADPDWLVRLEAARHAPMQAIAELIDDPEPDVQALVRARLEEFLKQEVLP